MKAALRFIYLFISSREQIKLAASRTITIKSINCQSITDEDSGEYTAGIHHGNQKLTSIDSNNIKLFYSFSTFVILNPTFSGILCKVTKVIIEWLQIDLKNLPLHCRIYLPLNNMDSSVSWEEKRTDIVMLRG